MRRADVGSRTLAVDVLNRSLLSGFLPLQGVRGLGLFLMEQIGPLRRAVMREGVAPMASQPSSCEAKRCSAPALLGARRRGDFQHGLAAEIRGR